MVHSVIIFICSQSQMIEASGNQPISRDLRTTSSHCVLEYHKTFKCFLSDLLDSFEWNSSLVHVLDD
jgi:hypothetical protein